MHGYENCPVSTGRMKLSFDTTTARKRIEFYKSPMCEICRERQALVFEFYPDAYTTAPIHGWCFTCAECNECDSKYWFYIGNFFQSPASTVDWLAHIHGKPWMDWSGFMDMMNRFREATGSFNKT